MAVVEGGWLGYTVRRIGTVAITGDEGYCTCDNSLMRLPVAAVLELL